MKKAMSFVDRRPFAHNNNLAHPSNHHLHIVVHLILLYIFQSSKVPRFFFTQLHSDSLHRISITLMRINPLIRSKFMRISWKLHVMRKGLIIIAQRWE